MRTESQSVNEDSNHARILKEVCSFGEWTVRCNNGTALFANEFGGTNILITTGHAFLYAYSPLTDDGKVDKSSFNRMDVEYGRHYLHFFIQRKIQNIDSKFSSCGRCSPSSAEYKSAYCGQSKKMPLPAVCVFS